MTAKATLHPESILSLAERIRRQAQKTRSQTAGADLRLAAIYLHHLAALAIIDEAAKEPNPVRKDQLEREAVSLWQGARR
jgi:hypothetical protein